MLAIAVALVVFSRSRWALLVAVIIPLFLTVGGTLASVVKDDVALRNPDDVRPSGVPPERLRPDARNPRRYPRGWGGARRAALEQRGARRRPQQRGRSVPHPLRASGPGFRLPWTFLQPNSFMSNTFQWLPQLHATDTIRAPFADVPVAMIDADDVRALAAAALTSEGHEGRAYRLSGPEPLLPADRVRVLAEVLARELHFEAQSDAAARAEMSSVMPPEYVEALFSFFADGKLDESTVLPTVRDILGRSPRTFEQWAIAHAEELGKVTVG